MPYWARISLEVLAGSVLAYGVAVFCVVRRSFVQVEVNRRVVIEAIEPKGLLYEYRCEARWPGVELVGRAVGPGEFLEYAKRDALTWKAVIGGSSAKPIRLEPGQAIEEASPGAWDLFQRFGVVEGLLFEYPAELSAGWPWPVARCWFTNLYGDPLGARTWIGKIGVVGGVKFLELPGNDVHSAIPTTPIWSGLALGTLFYGTLVHSAVSAVVLARGWSRRRRGLCGKCAYAVGALAVCPECGTPVRG